MSSENGVGDPTPSRPIYHATYPGQQQGNTNYGFHGDVPQTPPPKYEDVVRGQCTGGGTSFPGTGRPTGVGYPPPPPPPPPPQQQQQQPAGTSEAVGFIFLATERSNAEKLMSSIFTVIFIIVVITILFSTGLL